MGFGGSMSAMIQSIKGNNALRKSRREKYKSYKKNGTTVNNEKLEFKQVSENELKIINAKNLKRIEKEEQRRLLTFAGIIILIIVVVYFLFL